MKTLRTLLTFTFIVFLTCFATAAPGDIDPTFGGTGKVTTPIGSGDDVGRSMAVQSDGKIVVAGHFLNGSNYDFALVRYTDTGALDPSFGGGTGKVTTPIGSFDDVGRSVAVQSDGKIVVAGYSSNGSNNDFALVRYTAAGALDPSFGGGTGKVTTPIGSSDDVGHSMAMQSDGKIVVAGYSRNGSNLHFALVRYTDTGALDPSFGGGTGKVTTPIGSSFAVSESVAVQSDGKIVVAGRFVNGSNADFALVRYTDTGALDPSFGGGTGKVVTAIGNSEDSGDGMALQGDGKIVVAGYSLNGNGNFALVRYTDTGALDPSFGGGTGKVTTPIGSGHSGGSSVAVQSDGRIVVAGASSNGSKNDFALVRYTAVGALDTTFGAGGKVTTAIGTGNDEVFSVAIQGDGKIVVAGRSFNGSNNDFALARYEGGLPIVDTFTLNGGARVAGAPLHGQFTEQGGVAWSGRNAFRFSADGRVTVPLPALPGGVETRIMSVPYVPQPSDVVVLEADVVPPYLNNEGPGVFSSIGFCLDPAPYFDLGFYNQIPGGQGLGQLWMLLAKDGSWNIFASHNIPVASGGAGSAPGFLPTGLNRLRLVYDGATNRVSASINGVPVVTNQHLGAFVPTIRRAGFMFHRVDGAALDNFSVNVNIAPPNTPPTLGLPGSPIIAEATGPTGAVVTFTATANDAEDGALTPTITPASGSTFAIGDTLVSVSATDSGSLTTSEGFIVRVRDTIAPVVAAHGNVTVEATSAAGATVTYAAATASDVVGVTSITYSQNSGTEFPIGTTTVTITAKDAANNVGTGSFTVTVGKLAQSITFSPPARADVSGALTLSATGGASGNPVTFSIVSGPGSVSGNTLTFSAVGDVVVRASQAGDANYEAATPVNATIKAVVNTAPVAVDDAVTTTTGDTTLCPLANDTDADGDLLSIASVNGAGVTISADGRGLTIPLGTPSFTYTVTDGIATDTGAVTVSAGAVVSGAKYWAGLLYDADGAVVGRANIAGIIGQNSSAWLRVGNTAAIAKFRLTPPLAGVATTLGTFTVNVTGAGQLDVTLQSGSNTFSGRLRPANQSAPRGVYHVALAGAERAVVPGGGVARVVVGAYGGMTVTCRLPDTKTVTFSSIMCDNGSFTFYGMVAGTNPRAAVSGECTLANLLQTDVTGELLWVKPVQSPATGLHRTGVDTVLTANGSAFIAGSALPNGAVSVHLAGGDLSSEINRSGTVVPGKASATGANFTWSMNPAAPPWIKATLALPGRPNVTGGGLYLPKSNRVWGWFTGTTVGGYFELKP